MPYYAVRRGRVTGVYTDWPSCQEQVKGFPQPQYKKFATEEEALAFINEGLSTTTSSKGGVSTEESASETIPQSSSTQSASTTTPTKTNQYSAVEAIGMLRATANALRASALQLMNGVDNLSAQIDQVSAFIHSGTYVPTAAASSFAGKAGVKESLKRSHSDFTPLGGGGKGKGGRGGDGGESSSTSRPAKNAKKSKLDPSGCTDCGFTGSPFSEDDGTVVYTDGASFMNGAAGAKAGMGVYWGPGDPNNTSARLPGRQTNNRAEIHAAVLAVQQAKKRGIKNVILHTDSQFLINGITKWIKGWKKNGWKLSSGGDVINREDFEKLDEAMDGMNVKWMHVKGHNGIEGNEAADKLANEGTKKPL